MIVRQTLNRMGPPKTCVGVVVFWLLRFDSYCALSLAWGGLSLQAGARFRARTHKRLRGICSKWNGALQAPGRITARPQQPLHHTSCHTLLKSTVL